MTYIEFSNTGGKLQYKSSNQMGKLVDITNELRAKLIDREDLLKNVVYQHNDFYVCESNMIMRLTRLEDSNVEALYIRYNEKHIIIVSSDSVINWLS